MFKKFVDVFLYKKEEQMFIWSQMLCCRDNGHKSAVSNNALFEHLQFCYCCL